ncbi:hypothetical protein Fmac_029196 [Flemingia macrophylla]|uniref:Tryptophan synthase beta chain-like PALP domain-containing protein n=1 Tax=Flemingia macrophylla TaxID=520843 RepID=A0ABD1L9N6_9FABA
MIRSNSLHNEILSKLKLGREEFTQKLLNRRWTLPNPETKIHQLIHTQGPTFLLNTHPSFHVDSNKQSKHFYIVRDDFLHPLVNGNKARKLDALLPQLHHCSVTDVVTCGGCQSAHTAAIAVLCAERGIVSHLLLRGDQPEILTGYNLMSTMYGNVTYVPRTSLQRIDLSISPNFLQMDVSRSKGSHLRKILVINEGAGDSVALLAPKEVVLTVSSPTSSFGVVSIIFGIKSFGSSLGETCDLRTNPLEGRGDDGITNAYQTYGKKIPQQGIG